MKKNRKAILAMITTAVLAAGALAGCGSASGNTTEAAGTEAGTTASTAADTSADTTADTTTAETAADETAADLSGSISMVGSTSMEKFANALSEAFMEKYPDVTVSAQFVGSGAGVEAVLNGTADIGNSSRNLKDEEKEKGAVENIVAIDGIAVVVDPANGVGGSDQRAAGGRLHRQDQ